MHFLDFYFTEATKDTLFRMKEFGMGKNDIDENGYVTLYHGGKAIPKRLKRGEIFFMTPSRDEAEDYAKLRGGEVFELKVKPDDVFWNTGSHEVEFSKGGDIISGIIITKETKRSPRAVAKGGVSENDPWDDDETKRRLNSYKQFKLGDILPKSGYKILDIYQFKSGFVQFKFAHGWNAADQVISYELSENFKEFYSLDEESTENIYYHGTDKEVADYVSDNGFGTDKRFDKGMEPSNSIREYTFLTPSLNAAKWYATQNMRIKNPAIIKVKYDGKVYWVDKKGIEKYGAMRQAVNDFGINMGSMIDVDLVKKTILDNGYSAIGFYDKDSMNKKAVLIFDPQNIKVIKKIDLGK